jgi:hypothetical protein
MGLLGRLVASPRALLVFEAAARCGSCGAAAREFNVTQPSVSRSIAQLEAELGVRLFIRSPHSCSARLERSNLPIHRDAWFRRAGRFSRKPTGNHARGRSLATVECIRGNVSVDCGRESRT